MSVEVAGLDEPSLLGEQGSAVLDEQMSKQKGSCRQEQYSYPSCKPRVSAFLQDAGTSWMCCPICSWWAQHYKMFIPGVCRVGDTAGSNCFVVSRGRGRASTSLFNQSQAHSRSAVSIARIRMIAHILQWAAPMGFWSMNNSSFIPDKWILLYSLTCGDSRRKENENQW